ncbi:hypothetical protein Tco_1391469 [Tanacetum coccineum]
MVVKETKFAKETKVAKEVIVTSSSDDEVMMRDEDIPEYYFVMPKDSNLKVYTSSASKASQASNASKFSTSSALKSKASASSYISFNVHVIDSNTSDTNFDETPSSNDTTDENIAKFEAAAKSKGSTSKPEKVTAHKAVTQNVQTKPFPAKSYVPIRNCILGLAAAHTWACIDSRLESRNMDISFTLGSAKEVDNLRILQSCNGLLLCSGSVSPAFDYVYNPCANLFKRIPQPENSHDDSHFHVTVVLRMAFDSKKSLNYKMVQVIARPNSNLEIQFFSSKTLETDNRQLTLYKLNIEDHDHPIITTIGIPHGDDIGSREFTIYEIVKECYVWMVRYLVNTDEFMTPLPE